MLILVTLVAVLIVAGSGYRMIGMPERSFRGPLPVLSPEQLRLGKELSADVRRLAGAIGERNIGHPVQMKAAADFIAQSFRAAGYAPRRTGYKVGGVECDNIEVELAGNASREIVVIGAHYDTVLGCPGANDNGSGVAALLALARRFTGQAGARTLRFVAFPNEEPMHFQTQIMGSWVYAEECRRRGDNIKAMMSLETIGYYSDTPNSQKFPLPGLGTIYPRTGNFISFVGNTASRSLVRQAIGSFRRSAQFPSEGAALPAAVPGVGWSDHWAFWQHGYPGIMITDTAPFRYPHYHAPSDTPDQLDYERMARVVDGLTGVARDLVNGQW